MSDSGNPIQFQTSTDAVIEAQKIIEATSIIEYQSQGHALVVGPRDSALSIAEKLQQSGATVVSIDAQAGGVDKQLTHDGIAVFTVNELQLSGHLGAYQAIANPQTDSLDLAVSTYRESGAFDVVIDLSDKPCLAVSLLPFGYFRVTDDASLAEALEQVPELVGTFDKPKFFEYRESICAHSRSEITACTACMDSCVAGAIQSAGEGIAVDPYLCQGCGACSTACPTGAISYAYPKVVDAITRTRELMSNAPIHTLVLHTEDLQVEVDAYAFNEHTLPLVVEEVSAFGMDYWSAMVCAGVQRILIVQDASAEDPNRRVLASQAKLFHRMLSGLRIDTPVVQLAGSEAVFELSNVPLPDSPLAALKPGLFAAQDNKRQTIRMAFDVLAEQYPPIEASQPLTTDSLFGRVSVSSDCTLCMACVSVCPGKALLDGQDTPALRLVEANCVQCGLCENACPESAITLEPRYLYSGIDARKIHTLKEEEPFHCIRCHKPFATHQMINLMMGKLEGHWMFGDDSAKRRLKMCEDCRVKDMFENEAQGIEVHKKTPSDQA
ncbi:MAG: 4Fe-4S binding protein [Gammaproteobacteria bacterium]|nr:4Fe-4S binding protein [Gammaproteobacteria bacterium]